MLCLFHFRTGGGEGIRGEGEGSPKLTQPGSGARGGREGASHQLHHQARQAPGTPGPPGSHHPFYPHLRPSFHLPFTHPLLPGLPLLVLLVPPGPSTTAWLPPPPVGRLRPGTAPRRHPAPPRPHHGEYLPPQPHLRQPRPGGWLVGLTPLPRPWG